MIKIECDRCGEQSPVKMGVSMAAGVPVPKPIMPEGWRPVGYPERDGSQWDRHLCETCTEQLRVFMGDSFPPEFPEVEETPTEARDDTCVRCGHSPGDHLGPDVCSGSDDCLCELSEAESTDPTWAEAVKAAGAEDCPVCGNAYMSARLGAHIANTHPGDYQRWADEQLTIRPRPTAPRGCVAHGGPDCVCECSCGSTGGQFGKHADSCPAFVEGR